MTKMLASVISAEEAKIALGCGVDLIDFKDPASGALGALPPHVIREGVNVIAGQCPTSATIGDIPMQAELLLRRVEETAACGVDYVKVGFFPAQSWRECIEALARFSGSTRVVAVLFADQAPAFEWLREFARAGFAGVMLDTADKTSGGLRAHLNKEELEAFVTEAKRNVLIAGLAGSLRIEDVPNLVELSPDYLGFRGALCAGARNGSLDRARVRSLLDRIRACYSESSGLKTPLPPRLSTCV